MNKVVSILAGLLTASVCSATHAQDVDVPRSGDKRFTTLIVETVYPYSIESYKPHPILDLKTVARSQKTPELAMVEMFASMRSADWNWNSSLWSPESLKMMSARDAAAGRTPEYWQKLWRAASDRNYQLLNRIEYGKYVLIEYEAKDSMGKRVFLDTMALKKIDDKWHLTQELAADPILMHWKNSGKRVQVAPNTIFNR